MDVAGKRKIAIVVRWMSRLIALPVTLFMALVYFGEFGLATSRLASPPFSWHMVLELLWILVLGASILAGFLLSWKWERLGATLFVIASIGVLVRESFSPIAWHPSINHYVPFAIAHWIDFGLPLLGLGVLFFISSKLSKNASIQHTQTAI